MVERVRGSSIPEPETRPVIPAEAIPSNPTARAEHSLQAMIELSQELSVSLDFYGIADMALFNLMGQLCTSKAALWIVPPDPSRPPVLLRSHGIRKQWVRAIGTACGLDLIRTAEHRKMPMFTEELAPVIGEMGLRLSNQAGIALYVPITAREKLFALIALGQRLDGSRWTEIELQVLRASLNMIGVALENTGLYNRLLEKHRQLRKANEGMKDLDDLKGEFLRNINHELRTPLTIIISYVDFLLSLENQEGQRKEFLQTVAEESARLKALLEKLLDFSALANDNLSIHMESADLADLVTSFHAERLPGVAESLHEFSLEIEDGIHWAQFDSQRLRQILDALVDNAVKFTPPGSRVTLRLSQERRRSEVWARIDLQDDGPGIPPERLPNIFEAFRQGDGSSTRTVGGMGVGLAYSRKLAESMGGWLDVESMLGRGTTFTLHLPAL
ncbi:MAG TPA: HAMP domain-containing sensor histidine kinase [Candidatus Eisenbacteria bacterium]|nr:HAMP domain-containing sensor histidine kinase [Candidatus Eisenbacteria bacterium]